MISIVSHFAYLLWFTSKHEPLWGPLTFFNWINCSPGLSLCTRSEFSGTSKRSIPTDTAFAPSKNTHSQEWNCSTVRSRFYLHFWKLIPTKQCNFGFRGVFLFLFCSVLVQLAGNGKLEGGSARVLFAVSAVLAPPPHLSHFSSLFLEVYEFS